MVADRPRPLAAALMQYDGVTGVTINSQAVEVDTVDPAELARGLPDAARREGVRIYEVSPADESMESVFRYLVEASV